MPNGIFPVPPLEHHPGPADERPGLALRIRTRWQRHRLDEQLSRGGDPESTDELALRAARLRSRAVRSHLANELVEKLDKARLLDPFIVKVRLQYAELVDCADDLVALAERLRDERPVDVRGAAMTARLLADRTGPLYRPGAESLSHALRAARFALDANAPTGEGLRTAA